MSIQDEIRKMVGDASAGHKRLIDYVVRQVGTGRDLHTVLEDPYVTNRISALERRALVEEPEVVEAVGESVIASIRASLDKLVQQA